MFHSQSKSASELELEGWGPTLYRFSQGELNELIRKLNVSKKSAAFRLAFHYRTRKRIILSYFTEENVSRVLNLRYIGLTTFHGFLKCVLLNNGNKLT